MKNIPLFSWRMLWYSILIWTGAILVSGLAILPWFYLVLPLVIFWLTTFYFKKGQRNLKSGLYVALFWFGVVAFLDSLEIIGPYFGDALLYFSDFRNWAKYPLILLVPVVYSLFWENGRLKAGSAFG